MMKQNIYISLLTMLILISSCTDYSEGINTNPNRFTEISHPLILPQVGLEVIKASHSDMARMSGMFTDQFTGSDRQYTAIDIYDVTALDFDNSWKNLYYEGITQAQVVEESAKKTGDKLSIGVAKLLKALLYGEAASLYGNIPFSEAIKASNPKYDKQKEVLKGVQTILNEAILQVGDAKVTSPLLKIKNVFVNNDASFKKIANSLKARYYLVAKDYENAFKYAKMGISLPSEDLLSSHSTASGKENMMYQFQKQRGGYLTVKGSTLQKLLDGTKPRLLNTPGDSKRRAVYFDGNKINISDKGYYGASASGKIITFVETKLIEAEAAARTGKDALTPFNSVRTHLATLYGGSFPNSTATGNELIKQILEEKYISLIGSNQIFNDIRRTNNLISVKVKGTGGKLPERFLYPQQEKDSNKNFPGLVDLYEKTEVNK